MSFHIVWAVPFLALASPAFAACPTDETIVGLCKAGSDLAADLAADMPVALDTVQLEVPLATKSGLTIVVTPIDDVASADLAEVARYLCDDRRAQAFVASGGSIQVLMSKTTFLDLTSCEAP